MAIKLLPDLETQRRIADATEDIVNKLTSRGSGNGGDVEPLQTKKY